MENIKCYEGKVIGENIRIGIVASRFNDFIVSRLLEGAIDALKRHGIKDEYIETALVPGAFEIPLMAKTMAKSGKYNGIICVGAVIKGLTPHFDYVCSEVSKGIAAINLEQEIPVAFGILTTNNLEEAIERAGTKSGNKGYDAAVTTLEMVNLLKEFKK